MTSIGTAACPDSSDHFPANRQRRTCWGQHNGRSWLGRFGDLASRCHATVTWTVYSRHLVMLPKMHHTVPTVSLLLLYFHAPRDTRKAVSMAPAAGRLVWAPSICAAFARRRPPHRQYGLGWRTGPTSLTREPLKFSQHSPAPRELLPWQKASPTGRLPAHEEATRKGRRACGNRRLPCCLRASHAARNSPTPNKLRVDRPPAPPCGAGASPLRMRARVAPRRLRRIPVFACRP